MAAHAIEHGREAGRSNKPADAPRTLEQFLAQQREIDLLRFITCGSRR